MLQVFGVNDHDSTQWLSSLLSQKTVVLETLSRALDADKSGLTFGRVPCRRPAAQPDEMRRRPIAPLFLAG